jgi:hypothetical protein
MARRVARGRRDQMEGADKNAARVRVRQTMASTKIRYKDRMGDLNEPQETTQLQGVNYSRDATRRKVQIRTQQR